VDETVPGEIGQRTELLLEAKLGPMLADEVEDREDGFRFSAP
jgi:hypothetical protein